MWRQDTLHCQQQLGEISCPRMYTSGTFFAVMEKYDFSHQEHQRLKEHGPKLIDPRILKLFLFHKHWRITQKCKHLNTAKNAP